jgi:hypothetical protein
MEEVFLSSKNGKEIIHPDGKIQIEFSGMKSDIYANHHQKQRKSKASLLKKFISNPVRRKSI